MKVSMQTRALFVVLLALSGNGCWCKERISFPVPWVRGQRCA